MDKVTKSRDLSVVVWYAETEKSTMLVGVCETWGEFGIVGGTIC